MWWRPETREPMEHVVRPKLPAAVGTRDASPVPSSQRRFYYPATRPDPPTRKKSPPRPEGIGWTRAHVI